MTSSAWAPPDPATATASPSISPSVTVRRPSSPVPEPHGVRPAPVRQRRSLVPTAWLKVLWCGALAGAAVSTLSSIRTALLCLGVALVALMTWSAIGAINVRRARPSTVYTIPPNPLWSALSWTTPLVLLAVLVRFTVWLEPDDVDLVDPSGLLAPATAAVLALPLLIAGFVPFTVLGRATAWVGGARRRWYQFYWVPMLAVVLTGLLSLPVTAAIGIDVEDGAVSVAGAAAVFGLLALLALPVILTCWVGWTAMTELERAARMTWERSNFPDESLDLSDDMVARAVAALYLESHPEG